MSYYYKSAPVARKPRQSRPKTKTVSVQDGYKRLTVRDRSAVGCPKVLEAWVPNGRWQNSCHEVLDGLYAAARILTELDRDVLYVEV